MKTIQPQFAKMSLKLFTNEAIIIYCFLSINVIIINKTNYEIKENCVFSNLKNHAIEGILTI